MSVATELQRIIDSKAAIKTAIENKGVDVGTGHIDTYASKIDLIDEWVAPSDWIDIGTPNDNEILLLVSDINPFYAFNVTVAGGYTVDWGDGTINNWASGVDCTHTYTVGAGKQCSRGYTTFKIRIYAQIPANPITIFRISQSYFTTYSILWAKLKTNGLTDYTTMFTMNAYVTSPLIECIEFPYSSASCNNFIGMCAFLYNLQKVVMPYVYSSAVNMNTSFNNCISLKEIDYHVDVIQLVSGGYAYDHSYNYSLKSIKGFSTLIVGNSAQSFNLSIRGTNNLKNYTPPTIIGDAKLGTQSVIHGVNTDLIFNSSWENKLTYLYSDVFNGSLNGKVVLPNSVYVQKLYFGFNVGSKTITFRFPDNSYSGGWNRNNVYGFDYGLISGLNLKTITNFPNLNNVVAFSGGFGNSPMLESILDVNGNPYDFGSYFGDTTSNMDHTTTFSGLRSFQSLTIRNKITGRFVCAGLASTLLNKLHYLIFNNPSAVSTWAGASPQIDIAYCSFNAAELNTLFTSIIATQDHAMASGKVVRITGCPGANTCDTTILTSGGKWTVNKTT